MGRPARVALVLSGGGARGAYEAGVVSYLCDGLPADTGVRARLDILCGTSVGAINACLVASTAHDPATRGGTLVERWTRLQIEDVLHLRTPNLLGFVRDLVGTGPPRSEPARRGGIVDAAALKSLVMRGTAWDRIGPNIEAGHLQALSVSATHVATSRTVVFVQTPGLRVPEWSRDPFVRCAPAAIDHRHARASAAIPFIFPAVEIDGRYYCDGGLRQNTPLAPAVHLGADAMIVVSLRHLGRAGDDRFSVPPGGGAGGDRPSIPAALPERPEITPTAAFLFGKALNAMWLDHLDYDLERMRAANALLAAGAAACGGDAFLDRVNASMRARGRPAVRPIRHVVLRPSRDVGSLAASYARSPTFAERARGLAGAALRRLAAREAPEEADLLSYLLYDGAFARQLVDLGWSDARARRDELATLFEGGEMPPVSGPLA